MTKPYSEDLRTPVVAAVAAGVNCRAAAKQFSIGVSSVVRWAQRFRQTGSVAAKPMGGNRHSRLKDERDWLLARVAAAPDNYFRIDKDYVLELSGLDRWRSRRLIPPF